MILDDELRVIINSDDLTEYAKGEAIWQHKKKICQDNHIVSDTRMFLGSIIGVGDTTMGSIKYIMKYGTEEQKRRARKGGRELDGRNNQIWAIAEEIRDNNYKISNKPQNNGTKVCHVCGQEKPISSFALYRTGTRGITCNSCRWQRDKRNNHAPKIDVHPISDETKICKVCGKEKPVSSFVKANGKYRISTCNQCRWMLEKQKLEQKEFVDTEKTRICKYCGKELPIEKFEISKGYRLRICRRCRQNKYKNDSVELQDIAMTEEELNDYLYNADNEVSYTIDDLVEEILLNGNNGIKSVETSLDIHNDLLTTEENKEKIIESLKTLSHRLYTLQLRFREN